MPASTGADPARETASRASLSATSVEPAAAERGEAAAKREPEGSPGAKALFAALFAFCFTPWASPAIALALGAALALTLGNPFGKRTAKASKTMLQACVVGLGFGMALTAVIAAGASGVVYTVAGIATALLLGVLIGRVLRVEGKTAFLITAGTSICGGSAIAAVGPAIGASTEAMSVSLATVFLLNAVALYLFPVLGHALHLSQHQFGVWAAVAIHDTSSVVGAAAAYGPGALRDATVLKLARALWIVPLALASAAWARRHGEGSTEAKRRVSLPWFIAFFVLAALVRTLAPAAAAPVLDAAAHLARIGLVATLFLIGAGLSRATLRAVGVRPMLQGLILWAVLGSAALAGVARFVPPR